MSEVCKKFNIPRSLLKDHIVGKFRRRKTGPKAILSMDEEAKLCDYFESIIK